MAGIAVLRNKQANMEIGITNSNKQSALYVKEGNEVRVFAYFPTMERAEQFIRKLEQWDRAGGAD